MLFWFVVFVIFRFVKHFEAFAKWALQVAYYYYSSSIGCWAGDHKVSPCTTIISKCGNQLFLHCSFIAIAPSLLFIIINEGSKQYRWKINLTWKGWAKPRDLEGRFEAFQYHTVWCSCNLWYILGVNQSQVRLVSSLSNRIKLYNPFIEDFMLGWFSCWPGIKSSIKGLYSFILLLRLLDTSLTCDWFTPRMKSTFGQNF